MDLGNKVMSIKNINAGSITTSPLPTKTITATETMMNGLLGLVPFDHMSVIPNDAERNYKEATNDTQVCELAWAEKAYNGSVVFKMWRAYVDSKTNLPKRVESYRKLSIDTEYTLLSVMEVQYLSDSEMKAVINEASSQVISLR